MVACLHIRSRSQFIMNHIECCSNIVLVELCFPKCVLGEKTVIECYAYHWFLSTIEELEIINVQIRCSSRSLSSYDNMRDTSPVWCSRTDHTISRIEYSLYPFGIRRSIEFWIARTFPLPEIVI